MNVALRTDEFLAWLKGKFYHRQIACPAALALDCAHQVRLVSPQDHEDVREANRHSRLWPEAAHVQLSIPLPSLPTAASAGREKPPPSGAVSGHALGSRLVCAGKPGEANTSGGPQV